MAETDILVYLAVLDSFLILTGILFYLRKRRLSVKKSKIITKPHFTKEEKRNFKKGMPVGFGIGILVYLPHIAVILGFQSSWAISLVQVSLLIVYLTMLFIYAGFKFIVALTSISLIDKKQGYIDGIFASFISVQIFVFLWFPEIFIP